MPDSKYAHLEADDVRKMTEAVQEGWKFFTEAQIKGDLAPFGDNLSRLLALERVRK